MKQVLRYSVLALLFWSLFPSLSLGQQMSLDDYLQQLEKGSPVLKQSLNGIASAQLDAKSARAALLPSLGANLSYQRDFTKSFLFFNDETFGATRIRTNFNNSIEADAVAEQAIYDPAALSEYKAARLAAEQAGLSHQEARNELTLQATKLFLQSLFVKESLKILEANQELAQAQKEQAQELFQKGTASELELRKAELYYQQRIPQIAAARNSYQTLINELKVLAGLPPEQSFEPIGSIQTSTDSEMSESSVSQNEKLQSLNLALSISELNIKAKKAAWDPVIKASLGYNLNGQDNHFRFKNNNRLFYGRASIQLPIFTGGYNSAQLQKACIEKENVRLELEHTQRSLLSRLDNARLSLGLALQTAELQHEAVRLSQKELEITEIQAAQGMVTATDQKQSRLSLTKAKLDLLEAELKVALASLEIKRILGQAYQNQ